MTRVIIVIVILCCSFSSHTQVLIPYKNGNLWGYANLTGAILINPKYDKVDFFDKFGGKVWKDSLIGYINANGDELVKPKYNIVIPITDSIYKVKKNGKWSLINVFGERLINQQYDGVYELSNSRYQAVSNDYYFKVKNEGKSGIITLNIKDKKGTALTPIDYNWIDKISNPFYKDTVKFFKININNKKGVIRVNNKGYSTIIEPKFKSLYYSRNTRKFYCQTEDEELTFNEIGLLEERVNINDLNYEEEVISDIDFGDFDLEDRVHYPIYKELYSNGFQGLITTNRNKVNREWIIEVDTISTIYDTIIRAYYNEQCYIVSKNNKWGAVKPDGEYIIPPMFDKIDIKSMKIQRMRSDLMDRYRFIVKNNSKWGVVGNVDKYGGVSNNGYQLVPLIYDEIRMDNQKNFYFIKLKDKFGVVSAKNYTTIIEPKYAAISTNIKIHRGIKFFLVKLTKESDYVYVSLNGIEFFK